MRTSSLRLGILAEDETDCQTIAVLARRLLGERTGVSRRCSRGCANLPRKAGTWMKQLAEDGCAAIILVHDLDRNAENQQLNDEAQLRERLERLPTPLDTIRHICIPIEELEAWFWSDPGVLDRIAPGIGQGRARNAPDTIQRPKEKLWHLSASAHRNSRYTTQLNPELARILDLDLCARRCPAFSYLRQFLLSLQR